ncbi:MAG TPA: M13 family metallopeptidase, partial [Candidatus Paceibacterota bacterium]|nr:M13 family metallopeptidase [Candidatus Paceibacterota bacterium]
LATFTRKLGYPEKWRDYSRFRVSIRDSYAENYMRGCTVAFERELRKIDKEVDKTEWHMLPQTVNAMYNHQWNQITFPAAILQPPFFDPRADDAVNYGAIGSVIGHELTHGFDDQGCKFDEEGNLSEWWTEEDKKCFAEKATVLVKQFSECTFFDIPVNGELTLGENIADLGGISIAFEALARAMTRKGRQENIDGFTPEQRFFLGYALVWRGNIREELARQYITIDPHSPGPLRVNMPLSNFPPFHEAFGCREGCAMYRPPEERAEIW